MVSNGYAMIVCARQICCLVWLCGKLLFYLHIMKSGHIAVQQVSQHPAMPELGFPGVQLSAIFLKVVLHKKFQNSKNICYDETLKRADVYYKKLCAF